jgi:hypothetical protein
VAGGWWLGAGLVVPRIDHAVTHTRPLPWRTTTGTQIGSHGGKKGPGRRGLTRDPNGSRWRHRSNCKNVGDLMWERLGGIHPLPSLRCSAPPVGKLLRLSRSGSARLRSLAVVLDRVSTRRLGVGDGDNTRGLGSGLAPSQKNGLGMGLIGDGPGFFGPKLLYQMGFGRLTGFRKWAGIILSHPCKYACTKRAPPARATREGREWFGSQTCCICKTNRKV